MNFFLTDEELSKLLDDIDRIGQLEAEAKADYDSSDRELKLIEAACIQELIKSDGISSAAAKHLVGSVPQYAERVKEQRPKQRRWLLLKAKLDALRTVFEAFRTYSANIRMST